MSISSIENTILPSHLKVDFDKFCTDLIAILDANLVSLVIYGGLAKEEFDEKISDVNLMIILNKLDLEALDKINPLLQKAEYKLLLQPFILAEEDIKPSASLFPIKFLDIKQNHINLWGKDCISALHIPEEHILRNCQRELRNLILRMNQFYIQNYGFHERLKFKLTKAYSTFIINLNILLHLEKGLTIQAKADIIEAGVQHYSINPQLIQDLADLKKGERIFSNESLKKLYSEFLATVRLIANGAERLGNG